MLLALTASVPIAHPAPTTLAALDPKVIAYYPATGGWTTMWKHWDPARYRADFARIAALDANTVRVFVPVDLCNATHGQLAIQPNGGVTVEAEGGAFSNAACFTSLDGVSFAP